MTRAKICGVRGVEPARAALAAGASMLGFVFYPPSHRYLTPDEARDLIAQVRSSEGSQWRAVGLVVNEPLAAVESLYRHCDLDLIQLSGNEDLAYCRSMSVPFIKCVRPTRLETDRLAQETDRQYWGAERVLLDAHLDGRFGGTGLALPWDEVRAVAAECILAGGLDAGNVGEAIERARPWAVDVSSGVERDKQKDPTLITTFLHEVQRADRQHRIATPA